MEKKYKLTDETIEVEGKALYRIEALKDFCEIKKGDKGGFIESEDNLSHEGNAWVYDNACVYGTSCVYDDARVCGNSRVYGTARVTDDACVCGTARVYDNDWVYDNALGVWKRSNKKNKSWQSTK